jgi:uncharacterized protein DUF3332
MDRSTSSLSRRAALTAACALLAAGCFGSFGATRALYKWNVGVSDNKWLRWLVFLVLMIIPVYGLFVFADVIVINTIEFFSGKNPVSGGTVSIGNGNTLRSSRTPDPNLIRHEHRHDGKLVRVIYVRRVSEHELCLLDAQMRPIARVELDAHGHIVSYDAAGRELSRLDPASLDRIESALRGGASPSAAVQLELARDGAAATLGQG